MKKNLTQLKAQAKKLKIKGFSTKKKDALVNSIMMAQARKKKTAAPKTKTRKISASVKRPNAALRRSLEVMSPYQRKQVKKMYNLSGSKRMNRGMSEYNGWTNYETWLINMYFDTYFIDYVTETYGTDPSLYAQVYEIGQSLEDIVDEMAGEILQGDGTYWIEDLVNKTLGSVDWRELANSTLDSIIDL